MADFGVDNGMMVRVPIGNGHQWYKITKFSEKHIYARWLGEQPFLRGDYVVAKKLGWPLRIEETYRVVKLQEVQHFLEWSDDNKPLAMEICDHLGNRQWVFPFEWKQFEIGVRDHLRFEVVPE